MDKTTQSANEKSFTKKHCSSIILCTVTIVTIIIFYASIESPLERVFMLLLGFMLLIPISMTTLNYVIRSSISNLKERDKKNPYTRRVDSNGNVILKKDYYKDKNNSKNYSGKGKIVTTEGYKELRNLINASSKNRLMDRECILGFKAELRNKLGTHYECYKGMTFSNDIHEIYTLIKSSKLTKEDYDELAQWLSSNLVLLN